MVEGSGGQNNSDLYFSAELQDNVSPTADQIEKRLKSLGASKHEIQMFLKAYDQATPKIRAAQEQLNRLPKEHIVQIKANTSHLDNAIQHAKQIAKAPIELTIKVKNSIDDEFQKFKQKIPRMEMELKNAVRNSPLTAGLLGASSTAFGVLSAPVSSLTGFPVGGLAAGGAGAVATGAGLGYASFRQNSQLEQNIAQLTVLMRSQAAAQTEIRNVIQFSTQTPFNMPDVLAADIRLRATGVNPNDKTLGLRGAANLGAGTQVPIDRAQGAISAASLGYFEQLNTLTGRNIRQSDFTYGGRYSGQTYQQAISDILKQFSGASQSQMQTFKGLVTNIQDVVQQRFVRPVGEPLFNAAKGMEQGVASNLSSPKFQTEMAATVDKIQKGLINVFQLVQQGKNYFTNSLEQPLKEIASNVAKVGAAFGEAFGGTVITGIKYVSEALTTVLKPITSLVASVPQIGELAGFLKALHVLGISTNTGVKDIFGGLTHLNLGRTIEGFKELTGFMSKLGLYVTVKSFLDMKNANDQLSASFSKFGKGGNDALDGLKMRFDELIVRANQLNKSVPQAKAYGAGIASAILPQLQGKARNPNTLADAAYYGSIDVMRMSASTGMRGTDMMQAMQTWIKTMNIGGDINKGMSPQSAMDLVGGQIMQAGRQLSQTLGISVPQAIKQAMTALVQFGAQLNQAHIATPAGASLAAALDHNLQGTADYGKYSLFPGGITGALISSTVAPNVPMLRQALKNSNNGPIGNAIGHQQSSIGSMFAQMLGPLGGPFTFYNAHANAGGQYTKDILSTFAGEQNMQASSLAANQQLASGIGAGTMKQLGISLPQFKSVLPGLGVPLLSGSQVSGMSNQGSAQMIVKLSDAADKVQKSLQNVNQQMTALQNTEQEFGIAQEQAAGAMAAFQIKTEKTRWALEAAQIGLQKFQIDAINPLQRALAAVSQQMADYQQHAVVPVQRAQEDWNQVMLRTSNALEDVTFKVGKAQFEMSKFHDGMLKGENALTAQIESLSQYNTQLDMLRLQNMGLQADISRTQFHQGFTSTVKPLMGFDLSREIQLGQERAQMTQDRYNTTYGYQHWQMDRAARPLFERTEMSFGSRMKGILGARSIIDTGTLDTRQIQDLQYQEQLKSRLLQEKMYEASIAIRPLQDKQYALNRQMFQVQQAFSLKSDAVARQQLSLQEQQLPIQHAIEHANNVVAEMQPKWDKHLMELTVKQGNLQDAVAKIHQLFGDFNANFDNNIVKGPASVNGHLLQIAELMGLSKDALFDIRKIMGGGGGHGGGWNPGGQNPSLGGRGPIGSAIDTIGGVVLNPLGTLQAGFDWTKNLLGGGVGGTIGGAAAFGAGLLGVINAAHITGVHATGALGARMSNRAFAHLGGETDFLSHPLLSTEAKLGAGLSGLREGAPWRGILHPTMWARTQLPETLARVLTLGAFTSVGHPIAGLGAAAYVGEMVGKRTGMATFNRALDEAGNEKLGSYKQFQITKALFGFITSPLDTIKGWFSTVGTKMGADMGKVKDAAQAANEAAKTVGLADHLKGTTARPLVTVLMDGIRGGLGSVAAKIGINTETVAPITDRIAAAADRVRNVVSDGINPQTTEDLKTSAHTMREGASSWLKGVGEDVKATGRRVNQVLEERATAQEASRASKLLHEGAGVISRAGGGFHTFIKNFGDHVGTLGKSASKTSEAAAGIEDAVNGAGKFSDKVDEFGSSVRDVFRRGVEKFVGGIDGFLGKIDSVFAKLHIPGFGGVSRTVSEVARASKDAGYAAELAKVAQGSGPEAAAAARILRQADSPFARGLGAAGRALSTVGRVAGVASFIPAAIDAAQGKYGQAGLQAANAGVSLAFPEIALPLQIAFGLLPGQRNPSVSAAGRVPGLSTTSGLYSTTPGGGGMATGNIFAHEYSTLLDHIKKTKYTNENARKADLEQLRKYQLDAIKLQMDFNSLTTDQRTKYYKLSKNQQIQAQQAELTGPKGFQDYLNTVGSGLNQHYGNRLKQSADYYSKDNKTSSDGYSNISKTQGSWLTALQKQIDDWQKKNGLHLTDAAKAGGGGAVATVSATVAGSVAALSASILPAFTGAFQHGGVVDADKHRVGAGRTVQLVEEGHPEVVIPLAPHRRDRAKSLIKQTEGLLGMTPKLLEHHDAVLTEGQKEALFTKDYKNVYNRLRGLHALPVDASLPSMTIEPNNSPKLFWGEGAAGFHQVHYSRQFMNQFLNKNNPDNAYAKDEMIHEMAHTWQNANTFNTTWMREGGAQAYSDQWAHKLYGISNAKLADLDSTYSGYVNRVKKQLGTDWVNKGQFDGVPNGTFVPPVVTPAIKRMHTNRVGQRIKHGDIVALATGGYVWPYSSGITSGRIDEGWDMAGSGQIAAIGDTGPLQQGQGGWPGTGQGYYYQLKSGIRAGQYVYNYENIQRLKPLGYQAKAGEVLANLLPGYPWLEAGWSTSTGAPTSQGRYTEGVPQPEGYDFQRFVQGLAHGQLIGGGTAGGALSGVPQAISALSLKAAPALLKQMGIVGPKASAIYEHLKRGWEKEFMKKAQAAGASVSTGKGGGAAGIALPGGWFRIGATIDPTGGQTGDSNMTFAELLEAGANAGMRPDLTQLLGEPRGAYGMPMGTHILARMPGGSKQFNIYKNDVGSGQRGDPHYKIDLHPGIAAALGWSPNSDIEVKHLSGGIQRVPKDNFAALLHKDEKVLTAAEAQYQRMASNTDLGFPKEGIHALNKLLHHAEKLFKLVEEGHVHGKKRTEYLKQAVDDLESMKTIENKMLLQQLNEAIKQTGPHARQLDHLLGSEIAKSQSKSGLGAAGTQASNLAHDLIDQLHNIQTVTATKRVANAGKEKQFVHDEAVLKTLENLKGIAEKKLKHDEEHRASKKVLAKDKQNLAHISHQIQGVEHRIKQESHLVPTRFAYHSLETDLTNLRQDKSDVTSAKTQLKKDEHNHHLSKAQLAQDKAKVAHAEHIAKTQQHFVSREESNFIKHGMNQGVAKSMLEYAIRHVGDKDNQGIISDAQLQAIPSALLKAGRGSSLGHYVTPRSHKAPHSTHHSKTDSKQIKYNQYIQKATDKANEIAKSTNHVSDEQLRTAVKNVEHVKEHIKIAKEHGSKVEDAHKVAQQSRDDSAKLVSQKVNTDAKHQGAIEKQFSTMVKHLSSIASKIDKLDPVVQNNITVEVDGRLEKNVTMKPRPPIRAPRNR